MSVPPELRLPQLVPSWRGALQALRQDLPLRNNYTIKIDTVKLIQWK